MLVATNTDVTRFSEPALRYHLGSTAYMPASTEARKSVRRQNFLSSDVADLTADDLCDDSSAKSLRLVTIELTQQAEPAKAVENSVDGIVIRFDDVSVRCELKVGNSQVPVLLPRALFPTELRCGLPISLEMLEESGVRKPSISIRELDFAANANIAAEFDEILAAFG